jgi:CyaY protein
MIEESQFNPLADATLNQLETALDACGADLDYQLGPGGVLEIEFQNGSKIIVNRHTAAREIWVAAKSGGFHFRPEGGLWFGTRNGEELFTALSHLISEQSGEAVVLMRGAGG